MLWSRYYGGAITCPEDPEHESYLMDPDACGCKAKTEVYVQNETMDDEILEWVTEVQLGGPNYLNDPSSSQEKFPVWLVISIN